MNKNENSVLLILDKTIAIGEQNVPPGDYSLHYHDHFEMEMVINGHGKQNLNGVECELNKNDIYLMRPLDYHKIHSDGIELITVNFKPDILNKWILTKIHTIKKQRVYHLEDEDYDRILYLIGLLKTEIRKENDIYNLSSNIIEMILIIFLRNLRKEYSEEDEFASKVIYYLQKNNNFTKKVTLEEIANYVGYSKYYTSTTFHKNFGITIQDFIINLRVEYAKKLLLETNFTVSEIGKQSGFFSVGNFYNNFTKLTGCTPLKFKKKNIN